MKSNSNNRICRRQSAAGPIRFQRIYPSSATGRTCIVSDSGGHQSASGGSAGGSASGTPARLDRPSPLNTPSSPLNQQLSSPSLLPTPTLRRQHCSSYTYPTENPRVYGILLKMPSKPNFQKSQLTVTLAMIRTYNEICPKTHKKSKPNPNPIQTQSEPDPNPIQTQCKPNPNPNQTQFTPRKSSHPPFPQLAATPAPSPTAAPLRHDCAVLRILLSINLPLVGLRKLALLQA